MANGVASKPAVPGLAPGASMRPALRAEHAFGAPAQATPAPRTSANHSNRRRCRLLVARPPTHAVLVQVHDDRDIFQASPQELPAIDIHSL